MTTVNSQNSHIGLAKQAAKGTPITETADFSWFLARSVGGGPVPRQSPLPAEIGGGMLTRGQVKLGVNGAAGLQIIPRPESLGHLLLGVAGKVTSGHDDPEALMVATSLDSTTQQVAVGLSNPPSAKTVFITGFPAGETLTGNVTVHGTVSGSPDTETLALNNDAKVEGVKLFTTIDQVDLPVYVTPGDRVSLGFTASYYVHRFTMDSDPASTPYWTVRRTVGTKFGEVVTDARCGGVVLDMAAVNFIEGQAAFDAIEVTKQPFATQEEHDAWIGDPDGSDPFISAKGVVKLNGTYQWKQGDIETLPIRAATLTLGNAHAVDEEFVVGSYYPRDIEILARSAALQFVVFVEDAELYGMLMYDPDGGDAWLAEVFESADVFIRFSTAHQFATDPGWYPSLDFRANKTQWLVEPIQLRGNNIVVVRATGMVCQPDQGEPFILTLRNTTDSY